MTQCVQCRATLPDHSRFCSECGADQSGGGGSRPALGPVEALQGRVQRLVRGQYELRRLLGKGGMGAVFLAHDLALEREVAIKVLPPDFSTDPQVLKRFQQEAKTAARLDHPNIIPIYRVESQDGIHYFVMKYISGTSLEDVLESKQPLSDDYVQRILWEAACALGHAHSRGIVHRDVKPANIMFDHDGRVMLTDFGISKALQSASALTGTGMIIGTPHYMAPEQAKGQPVDGRADQYSLGVVGYRLLARALPFSGDSVHTILYKHIFEEAPRVAALRSGIPAHLAEPIQRALSKDPAQRYPTMEAFATAIWPEQPVGATGVATPRPVLQPRAPSPASAEPTIDRAAVAAARTTPMHTTRPRGVPARPAPRPPRAGVGWPAFVAMLLLGGAGVGGYLWWRGAAPGGSPPAPGPGSAPSETLTTAAAPPPPPVDTTARDTTAHRADATATPTVPGQREERPARSAAPALTSVAPQGYLNIDATPFGTVFVDGVNVGPTPLANYAVPPGRHRIRIESTGYKTVSADVDVTNGNTVRKRFVLIPEG